MKPRILIVDTYYPDFLKSLPFDPSSTYDVELRKVLDRSFGTADFYSRNLKVLGWDAVDVIANHGKLQGLWSRQYSNKTWIDLLLTGNAFIHTGEVLQEQINKYDPDVVFIQDLSLPITKGDAILAGQLSCPWPGDEIVKRFDILFSSFPHYIERIQKLGVRAIYNPLAFEPSVLGPFVNPVSSKYLFHRRPHDVVFIGGVGNPSHWRYGMEVLETVAREIQTFKWWGYGYETLPADSALRRCYQGEAWGLQMYEILLMSKICLNRHGEVAEGYANNMRMVEATGCGALLLTEQAKNLQDFFTDDEAFGYANYEWAVEMIRHFLANDDEREAMAKAGQQRTLRDHTYAQRMKTVSETLKGMLVNA